MADKKSFVLYCDYKKHFALLPAEDQGRLLMAIFDYVETGAEPALEALPMMAFSFIRAQLERDMQKYKDTCERRAEAGRRSGEARRAKAEQNEQSGTKRTSVNFVQQNEQSGTKRTSVNFVQQNEQSGTKRTDTDNGTDNVTDNDTDNVTDTDIYNRGNSGELPEKRETTHTLFQRLLPDYVLSPDLQAKMDEWITYKTERKEPYNEQSMKTLLRQVENNSLKYGDKAVCNLIDDSMANGWKGIIFDRLQNQNNQRKPASGGYQRQTKAEELDDFYKMADAWANGGN